MEDCNDWFTDEYGDGHVCGLPYGHADKHICFGYETCKVTW